MKNWKFNRALLLVGAFVFLMLMSMTASETTVARNGDEQRQFLEVRRRQLELEAARKQYNRTQKLATEGLVSQNEVERDRNAVATAQLNYQQAVLSLLNLQPRMSVRTAVKSQTPDGRKFVKLVIANLTPTFDDSQFKLLNNFDGADPIPEQLRTRTVNDVFVSLRDSGEGGPTPASAGRDASAIISLPYEVHIPQLQYGETKTLNFQLLRDVDSLIVALNYRGQVQEVPLQLQHAAGGNEIQISSSHFSQEADLGNQATYNLTFERPTVDVRSFQLKAVNLPRQISYSFVDPQSQARLSQINFPAGVTRQSLGLKLFLPDRADQQVQVDKPLELWALALDDSSAVRFEEEKSYSESEIEQVAGKVKLVVLPRGVGKIEVFAPSLFSEIRAGEDVEAKITIRNSGTRRLDNIKLSAEYPLNWRAEVDPNIISSLDINREDVVTLKIQPPPDIGVGEYEVRIKTESYADNRRVETEDKIYRVSVKARTNLLGTGALIGSLLLLVVGIVVFGVKITRR